jgi:hypothetical protein
MNKSEPPDSPAAWIDSIAEIVPEHLRAAYYRDMHHCHTLNDSDEMLKIMNVVGWTTVIMAQVPARIAAEIGKLDRILRDNFEGQQRVHQRLDKVFDDLVERVSAETVANQLYESLRQQFVETMIPQTGRALAAVAGQIGETAVRLERTTPKIVMVHKQVASEAMAAMRQMHSEISAVTSTARQATAELSRTFLHQYRWALGVFVVLALILGLLFGIYIDRSGFLPR